MTHTVEVMRIARTIARGLRLNEDLTEAAAFGHDLGHTPFGHAGERVLGELMDGGFQHNIQSLRVVDKLEKGGQGLNLTYEVRDGILCHTGPKRADTLEGRIIHLADQIAYINHDIDDAMRAKIIYPMDIPLYLLQSLGFSHSERINTLTLDVIHASKEAGDIVQSPEKKEDMSDLRAFMFDAVYRNPVAKGQEHKAQDLIRFLFEHYQKHPDDLPGDFQDIRYQEGVDRAACDYIAGMTDNFAVEVFSELTLPKAWTVK
jgi:dGTPase